MIIRDEPFSQSIYFRTLLNLDMGAATGITVEMMIRRPHSACISGIEGYRVPKPLMLN